jgi:hypothetical protein
MPGIRVFELHANGEVLHLIGNGQVAEMIALLGRALRGAENFDDREPELSWEMLYEHEPIKMECRSKLCGVRERRRLTARG